METSNMPGRILVVDDEPDAAKLFRRRFRGELRRGEYEIDFAHSGAEALEKLEDRVRDNAVLVVSDVAMPGMTGFELLQQIKQRWPELRVVMMTAFGDGETRRRAVGMGADDLFAKPIDFTLFKEGLRRLVVQGEAI
jgi:CheY-like chemotaxis protein